MNEFVFFSAIFGDGGMSFRSDQCDRGTEERVPVFFLAELRIE